MTDFRIAPVAQRDLLKATRFIAKRNLPAGHAFAQAVNRAAGLLGKRPLLGSLRLEILPGHYRFWSLQGFPYVLVYLPDTMPISIVRIVHTSRDLHAVLADLEE